MCPFFFSSCFFLYVQRRKRYVCNFSRNLKFRCRWQIRIYVIREPTCSVQKSSAFERCAELVAVRLWWQTLLHCKGTLARKLVPSWYQQGVWKSTNVLLWLQQQHLQTCAKRKIWKLVLPRQFYILPQVSISHHASFVLKSFCSLTFLLSCALSAVIPFATLVFRSSLPC